MKYQLMLLVLLLFRDGVQGQSTRFSSSIDSSGAFQAIDSDKARTFVVGNVDRSHHSLALPVALISYGFLALGHNDLRQLNHSTASEIREDHHGFETTLDNYLQYTPAAAVYALNAAGLEGKHNFLDRSAIYALSGIINFVIVSPLKKITRVQRPDGSGFNSFPSGHSATAFASAEFMRTEYCEASPWLGVLAYGAATATGALRLYNNKHWVSDVVAGAGIGILSTKLAYALYPMIRKKLSKIAPANTSVAPFYSSGQRGVLMVYTFK